MSKKEQDVELIPSNIPSGWKVKHGNKVGDGPSGPNKYPDVDFAPGSGPHLVVFKLPPDSPGFAARFNANDPMWVQKGTTSPTQPGFDAQITDWAIFDGGKTLVLLDSNTDAGPLSYRVKADGYAPVLDPIIRNGGTLTPPSTPSYSATELVVAGLALLLAFLVGIYVQRRLLTP